MRFEYPQSVVLSPDDGEPAAMFRPEIPVSIRGAVEEREFLALVDTGADHIVLPGWISDVLKIETQRCRGPSPSVYTGAQLDVRYADVELTITHEAGSIR